MVLSAPARATGSMLGTAEGEEVEVGVGVYADEVMCIVISSVLVPPSLSVTVSLNTYAPATRLVTLV